MASHRLYGKNKHTKPASTLKKVIRVILVIIGVLLLMSVIGNFLPSARAETMKPAAPAAQPAPSQRPVMGYNTWYQYGAAITENEVLRQAGLLVSSGLAQAGYTTVTIDDGWQASHRDASGNLRQDPAKFPHGMMWLGRQLHGMGLKFGIYTAIGANTCTNHGALPGSFGHYVQDAAAFSAWSADFVKVDSCKGLPAGTSTAQLTAYFKQFGTYISNNGMVYSEGLPVLLPLGSAAYYQAVAASSGFADMWRTAPDEHPFDSAGTTVIGHLQADQYLYRYARPGHWNDLDMLVPGNPAAHPFGWTLAQEQDQLAVWAQESSPLFLSTDIAKLTGAELASLKNPHLLNVDQSGSQAPVIVPSRSGHVEMLVKGADGGKAVLFANLGSGPASAAFSLAQAHVSTPTATYQDVWTGAGGTIGGLSVNLPAGGTRLVVLK